MTGLTSIFKRYSVIKQIPLFSKLRLFELQKITQKARIIEYRKGEFICKQGMPSDAFYCLVSGRIQSYSLNAHGKKFDVEFIRRGMPFGIISLLSEETHSHSYEAINDSVVLKIDRDPFHAFLHSCPQLSIELSQNLSRRIRNTIIPTKSFFESTIISVYSPVQGTGSSTYTVNLAFSLEKEAHKKVIFVNIISSGSSGQTPDSSLTDEASPRWKVEPVPLKAIVDDYDKITKSICSGESPVDQLHVSFDPNDTSLVSQISRFVSTLGNDYHYVIVDLPNEMDDVVLKTLTQSDLVHLITLDQSEHLTMTRRVIDHLEENLKENFHPEKIQVIISGRQDICYLSYEEINQIIDFPITTKLPHISPGNLHAAKNSSLMTLRLPDPESEYARAVTQIARRISGVLVGLVLGGGAALGIAHIGVIRVLEQERIPIDVVVGSSMGALLASFWTTGKNAHDLELLAREFETQKGILKLFDPVIPISGLIGGRLIKRWLRTRGLGNKTFYSTRIPLKIVAYDLVRREEIIIDSGSILDAVRKSIAIPGVIEPVLENGREIIDGGVLNPLPTNVLSNLGIKKIIAVNVLQSPNHVAKGFLEEQERIKNEARISLWEKPWDYMKMAVARRVKKAFTPNISDIIVRSLQASEYVIAEQSAKQADIVIHPDLSGINWFELYKVDTLIQRGEDAARRALPAIQQLVKE